MRGVIEELLPHAPQHGLYRKPDIPEGRLKAALGAYASGARAGEVLALYDATRMGTARDGAVFLSDRFIYRNHLWEPSQTVRYEDVVQIGTKSTMLGGRKLILDVNEARATVTHELDFSARRAALAFVQRFLEEVLHAPAPAEVGEPETDRAAVRAALDALVADGRLAEADRQRMLEALGG